MWPVGLSGERATMFVRYQSILEAYFDAKYLSEVATVLAALFASGATAFYKSSICSARHIQITKLGRHVPYYHFWVVVRQD